jgi:hypothetical protein
MDIKRAGTLVMSLNPSAILGEAPGEFTVSLLSSQSEILETGDVFDIQLTSNPALYVWTVASGSLVIFEDVTN